MGGIFGDNFDGHTFSLMLSILIGFTMVRRDDVLIMLEP